ncbi:MAG TPA: carboxypeptidase regulatory-like domain-containing protein [Vicinamibacterales bacterium]|nr:carboxypeptidase regulatory-like domain-containing protein [Vicinamibacterales bacterium]
MKRAVALVLTLAVLAAYQLPTLIAAGQNTGEIAGNAVVEGKPMPNVMVRLRNVDNGQLVGNITTDPNGAFKFTGLPPGNFMVETIANNGILLGTSAKITLGAMVAGGVTVTTSAAAAAAAGAGAVGVAAGTGAGAGTAGAAAAGAGAFFASKLGIITIAAVAAGLAIAAVAANDNASPIQ